MNKTMKVRWDTGTTAKGMSQVFHSLYTLFEVAKFSM